MKLGLSLSFMIVVIICLAPVAEAGQIGSKAPSCTVELSIRPVAETGDLRVPKPEFFDVVDDRLVALWSVRDDDAFRRQVEMGVRYERTPHTIAGAIYDLKKGSWSRLKPPSVPLSPRGKYPFVYQKVGKQVVVVEVGWTAGAILSPATGKWTPMDKAPFVPGEQIFAQAAVGDCWIVWIGIELHKGFCLDVLKNRWQPVAQGSKATMGTNKIGVVGHKLVFPEANLLPASKTPKRRTAVYNTRKKLWTFQRQGKFPRSNLAYSEPGRQTILFAGMSEDYSQGRGGPTAPAATGAQLNLRSGKWRSLPSQGGPNARFVEGHIPFRPEAGTLWTGRYLVIRGIGEHPETEPRQMEDRALDTRRMRWVRVPPPPGKGLTLFRDGAKLIVRSLPQPRTCGVPVRGGMLDIWVFDLPDRRWCKARLDKGSQAGLNLDLGNAIFHLRYGKSLVLWGIGRTQQFPHKRCPPGAPCAMAPKGKEHFFPGGLVLSPAAGS